MENGSYKGREDVKKQIGKRSKQVDETILALLFFLWGQSAAL